MNCFIWNARAQASKRPPRRAGVSGLFVLACLTIQCTSHAAVSWFQRALVGMEVGPTGAQYGHSDPNDVRYCANFNGREIVRAARKAGSEYLVLWGRDADYAYY